MALATCCLVQMPADFVPCPLTALLLCILAYLQLLLWQDSSFQPPDRRPTSCCRGKTNFFEKRVGDYQKSGVMAGLSGGNSSHAISFNEDF